MVMDVCVCGEQRYIWHTGADQSMEEVGWRERERGVCYCVELVHTILTKNVL